MILTTDRARLLTAVGIASLATFLIVSVTIHSRLREYQTFLDTRLTLLERTFVDAAQSADRTEALKESTDAVPDCAMRNEFDALLSTLDTLGKSDRARLGTIYPLCADYYYRLKLFHIERLDDIHAEYQTHLDNASFIFRTDEIRTLRSEAMLAVITGERERANAMREQVVLQEDVISAVGLGTQNDTVLTERVSAVQSALTETNAKIDTARTALESSLEGQ